MGRWALLVLLAAAGAAAQGKGELGNEAEVVVVGEVEQGAREERQFGVGRPNGPGRGRLGLGRLDQGPLTLQGGQLRPVGPARAPGRRPGGVVGLQPHQARPALPSLRPHYFPSDNVSAGDRDERDPEPQVPFRYNAVPAVPEVAMQRPAGQAGPDSPSEHFGNFQQGADRRGGPGDQAAAGSRPGPALHRPYPGRPLRAEVLDDWSAKVACPPPATIPTFRHQVAQSTDGKQNVLLDTKYFSLSYPEVGI
jgi:hypothetical protein